MKKLVLLSIFLALPLMAQAPADPIKDFMAEHAQNELAVRQLTAKVAALEAQLKAAQEAAAKCSSTK